MGAKSMRENKFKRKRPKKQRHLPATALKSGAGLLALSALSLLYIFCYDLVTQCDYLKTNEIIVVGHKRLSENLIRQQAGIAPGMNILAFNLALARKSLLVHPWIAEADIRRVIPAGIRIRIKEHRAVAVIDLGRKYLINEVGVIFKELDPADPGGLPIIRGLRYADIQIDYGATPLIGSLKSPAVSNEQNPTAPKLSTGNVYDAVVAVLALGNSPDSVLPNRQINQIRVDREIGLTLHAFNRTKTILLGFNEYAGKYAMLNTIMRHMKSGNAWHFEDIKWIDLKNLNRIVINPFRNKEKQ